MKLTRFALPFALIPGAALADVTPQDVWNNLTAAYGAAGLTLDGTVTPDGDNLTLSGGVLRVDYPQGLGSATLTFPNTTLTAMGDGTVGIMTDPTYLMELAVDVPDTGLLTGNITIAQTNVSAVASGNPGDVTYTSSADKVDVLINNVSIPGEELEFSLEVSGDGYTSTTRVTEGDNLTITLDNLNGAATSNFVMAAGPMRQESTSAGGELRMLGTIVLPPEMNIMDLTPALLSGLSMTLTTQAAASEGTSKTFMDGALTNEQVQATGATTANMTLNADGFAVDGSADGFDLTFSDQTMLPFPVSVAGGELAVDVAFPLVARDTPQDFKYGVSFQDLSIDESLWGMFDPAGSLDQSPADLTIDVSGSLNWGVNLFNVEELIALEDAQTSPVTINSLSINDIGLAALGATANATGAFTFDNADMDTIPGMPRPEGSAKITATGLNAAIDQLVGAGFIPEEEAMMPRMMMGMFARTVGEDQLETEVEVNAEGHVIVNGQRMR